jgi:serine/threonine protein kinase
MAHPDPTPSPPSPPTDLSDGEGLSTATGQKTVSFITEDSEAPVVAADSNHTVSSQGLARYEIRKYLGSGAFGTVSLAWDNQLHRDVAIKQPRVGLPPSAKQLFVREARLVARLRHPSVVVVHDVQVAESGDPFIVYEYVPGQSLRQKLKELDPLPCEEALKIATAIAEGLSAAHQLGLTHRDLKPANILLDPQGCPRIADFGLAIEEVHQRALKGEVAGTSKYMAPEQLRGETHQLDGRTDLWALGVIFYELLTGRHPFPGEDPADVIEQILNRDPRPPRQWVPEIPQPLEDLVLRLLAKPVSERIGSAREVLEILRKPTASSPAAPLTERLLQRRWDWKVVAIAALVGVLGLALAGSLVFPPKPTATPRAVLTDDDFDTGAWTKLMKLSPPGVASLDETTVLVHEPYKLSVSSEHPEYMLLGRTHARNYSVKIKLFPRNWNGGAGLFLGYVGEAGPTKSAVLIGVAKNRDGQAVIERQMTTQQAAGVQNITHLTQLSRSTNSKDVGDAVILQVEVEEGRVTQILLDGVPMNFSDPPFPVAVNEGMIGIYNHSGGCTFLNPEFLRR